MTPGYQINYALNLNGKVLPLCGKTFFIQMKDKSLIFIINFLILSYLLFVVSIPIVEAEEIESFEQQKLTSHLLINLFLEKVGQGELVIFKQTIKKSDLQSHQVSYVHNIIDDSLLVRLCFKLHKQILVPKFEDFYVDRITVETDKNGSIMQIATHVSPLTKEKGTENHKEKQ